MVAAVAALPPRWVVGGGGSNDTADVVVGPESVGTFAGFGADLVVRLSPQASGRPVEVPLCAMINGGMRDQAQPDARAEVRVYAATHDGKAALTLGRELRNE